LLKLSRSELKSSIKFCVDPGRNFHCLWTIDASDSCFHAHEEITPLMLASVMFAPNRQVQHPYLIPMLWAIETVPLDYTTLQVHTDQPERAIETPERARASFLSELLGFRTCDPRPARVEESGATKGWTPFGPSPGRRDGKCWRSATSSAPSVDQAIINQWRSDSLISCTVTHLAERWCSIQRNTSALQILSDLYKLVGQPVVNGPRVDDTRAIAGWVPSNICILHASPSRDGSHFIR
jgi:hypothetical protein